MNKDELISFLGHIGDDFCADKSVVCWPECEGQSETDEDGWRSCPEHQDCGICRYEYMKTKGWLAEVKECT